MKLLILGELKGYAGLATRIAIKKGAKVIHGKTIDEGLKILRDGNSIELILADVYLDIKAFINALKMEHINTPTVVCGVEANSQKTVEAIKAGAKEYLPMPPDEELIGAVLDLISRESHQMIFQDKKMEVIEKLAKKISRSDASVLITGDSGTGKEVMSRFIHNNSNRKDKGFVAVNCAAIPDNLLESELFGHEKGAFTGAIAKRIGKFEEAEGGTVLLDEISEIDIKLQAKLLRVLQEREIVRIGGNNTVKINVRILATSNRDLEKEIELGNFRQDLYFRLNVINIELPPLKDRPKDIEILSEHFIKKFSKQNGITERQLSKKALQELKNYDWPGNIRELENTMHRAVLLSDGNEIQVEAIMLQPNKKKGLAKNNEREKLVGYTMVQMEKMLIVDTLKHTLGNETQAANILGISIRTLKNKLKEYEKNLQTERINGD